MIRSHRVASLPFVFVFALTSVAFGQASRPAPDPRTTLDFREPARSFTESCPVGDGRLGAMMFGGTARERVVLNESTLWSGTVQDSDRTDAKKALPEIRRLLLAGKNGEAQSLLSANFVARGPGSGFGAAEEGPYGCYQTLGDLLIEFADADPEITGYSRDLDLESGVATTRFLDSGGVRHRRRLVASAPGRAILYAMDAKTVDGKPSPFSFTAKLAREKRVKADVDGRVFVIGGELASGVPGRTGVRYEARLAVKTNGKVTADRSGLHVSDATEALLVVVAATDMFDAEAIAAAPRTLADVLAGNTEALFSAAAADHARYFRRVSIELPVTENSEKETIERLKGYAAGAADPALAALFFNYGRYLLIASSRPESPLPANLQGLWAEEYQTPWNGDFHIDINLQMNYWPAETTNLSDCAKPLLDFIPRLVVPGRKTAAAYYGARGWTAHVITNPWLFTSPGEGADWGSTLTGGAWLCSHLYEHFLFTRDYDYLAKVYPVMKEAALFFKDVLIEDPETHRLVTAPSNSPENAFKTPGGAVANTCMGPTMDQQIVRRLFGDVIAAANALATDGEFVRSLEAQRAVLAPTALTKDGRIREWLEDYEEVDPKHRHTSHLWGLFPGDEITPRKTPELAAAAKKTLDRRGDASTGWAMAWRAAFWARLGDGDRALKLLNGLWRPVGRRGQGMGGGSYANLFCAHPPFQIDGNFGGTAAIAEMLLQSHGEEIELLPALPAAWPDGRVKGLCARGGVVVNIDWRKGRVMKFRLMSAEPKEVKVRIGDEVMTVTTERLR